MNQFIQNLPKKNARTQNNALSNSSTGSHLLDYFSNVGSYMNRDIGRVWSDFSAAFGEDPILAIKMVLYTRMVTRRIKGFVDTEEVQTGLGNKDESRKAFAWLAHYYPEYFPHLLFLWVSVGYWKDLWDSVLYDYLEDQDIYYIVREGLKYDIHRGLLAKYLPRIRSYSNINNERHVRLNEFARGLCNYLGWTEEDYRKFKSHPDNVAHLWQRQMSAQEWNEIDFNTIPGRALFLANSQRGRDGLNWIERHDLEGEFISWLEDQPTVKFTGWPHELYKAAFGKNPTNELPLMQKITFDKQFEHLLSLVDGTEENVLVANDTSGSMWFENNKVNGVYPGQISDSLSIYFSALNTGAFKDRIVMFDDESRIIKLSGSFTDRVLQIHQQHTAWGSTNFLSVIDEIVRVRVQNPDIPIEDFPTILLVVSDMQFNPAPSYGCTERTNYEEAMRRLKAVGLPEITVIWWQVNGRYGNDFPSTMDDKGTILLSGFDGSILSTLLNREQRSNDAPVTQIDPYEAMLRALDQEVLNMVGLIIKQ